MGRFIYLETVWGSELLARRSDGTVVNRHGQSADYAQIVGFIPDRPLRAGFLFADLPVASPARIPPLEPVGRLTPLKMTGDPSAGAVSFYSPWTGLFLIAAKPETETEAAPVALAERDRSKLSLFRAMHAGAAVLPSSLHAAATIIDRAFSAGDLVAGILDIMQTEAWTQMLPETLNALALLLTPKELRQLATSLSGEPRALEKLREFYPNDLAAAYALPALEGAGMTGAPQPKSPSVAHGAAGAGGVSNSRSIGPDFDHLDRIGLSGNLVSLPFAVNQTLRAQYIARERCCIVATARNEGVYLLDWIAYHKALGFEQIFLYTNDNTDRSDELLERLSLSGEIVWIDSRSAQGTRPQWKAYNHALRILPDILDYDWALFIDLDEYLKSQMRTSFRRSLTTLLGRSGRMLTPSRSTGQ